MMAQTIVSFENGKIIHSGLAVPNTEGLRVVSMVGKARRGKSTFLNAIVSLLNVKNATPFMTSDGDDHCTKSVDAWIIPELNLMLLDSRGLAVQDSQNDEKLLLFLHQVSDMIIFNERQRLDNTCLKLLEGLCTFTPDLDEELRKPKLFFRVADCEIKDTNNAIEALLTPFDDQYQSIRYTIRHLFDADIRIIPTEQLDKNARNLLNEGKYLEVIQSDSDEYKFAAAIKEILNNLPTPADSGSFFERMSRVVNDINTNPEITEKKLDIVGLQTDRSIREWIDKNVSKTAYSHISVDGTQKSYNDNVQTRKNQKKSILTSFTNKWKAVAKELRDPHYHKLATELGEPIQKAVERCEKEARQRIAMFLQDAETDRSLGEFNNINNSFTNMQEGFFKTYLAIYDRLRTACNGLYDNVREEMEEWVDGLIKYVMDVMGSVRAEEAVQKQEIEKVCDETLMEFSEKFLEIYNSSYEVDLKKSNKAFLENYREVVLQETLSKLVNLVPIKNISFKLTNKKMTHTITKSNTVRSLNEVERNDLVNAAFIELKSNLNTIIYAPPSENEMDMHLTICKEETMAGKMYKDSPNIQIILRENPGIEFVCDFVANQYLLPTTVNIATQTYIMTKRTYTKYILPLYKTVAEKLVQKGLCATDDNGVIVYRPSAANLANVSEYLDNRSCSRYGSSLKNCWFTQLHKVFCKNVVAGFELPEIVTL